MTNKKMVQYSVWPNCNNNCKFCLRKDRSIYSLQQQIDSLHAIVDNITTIDWKNEDPYGISLLGGEIYNITDKHKKRVNNKKHNDRRIQEEITYNNTYMEAINQLLMGEARRSQRMPSGFAQHC